MINRIVNAKDYALIDEYLNKSRTQTNFQGMYSNKTYDL